MSLSSLRFDLRSAPIVPLGTPPYEDPLPHSLSGLEWHKISGNDCFPFAWLLPVGHRTFKRIVVLTRVQGSLDVGSRMRGLLRDRALLVISLPLYWIFGLSPFLGRVEQLHSPRTGHPIWRKWFKRPSPSPSLFPPFPSSFLMPPCKMVITTKSTEGDLALHSSTNCDVRVGGLCHAPFIRRGQLCSSCMSSLVWGAISSGGHPLSPPAACPSQGEGLLARRGHQQSPH